jgi:hypothetical protein
MKYGAAFSQPNKIGSKGDLQSGKVSDIVDSIPMADQL